MWFMQNKTKRKNIEKSFFFINENKLHGRCAGIAGGKVTKAEANEHTKLEQP